MRCNFTSSSNESSEKYRGRIRLFQRAARGLRPVGAGRSTTTASEGAGGDHRIAGATAESPRRQSRRRSRSRWCQQIRRSARDHVDDRLAVAEHRTSDHRHFIGALSRVAAQRRGLRARRSTKLSEVLSKPAHARRSLHDEGFRRIRDVSPHSGPESSALRAASWQALRVCKHLVQDNPRARVEATPKAGASRQAQGRPQSDASQRVLANRRNRDPADDRHPNLPPSRHRQFQPKDSRLGG